MSDIIEAGRADYDPSYDPVTELLDALESTDGPVPLWWVVKHESIQAAWERSQAGLDMLVLLNRHFPSIRFGVIRSVTMRSDPEHRRCVTRIYWKDGSVSTLLRNSAAAARSIRRRVRALPNDAFVATPPHNIGRATP